MLSAWSWNSTTKTHLIRRQLKGHFWSVAKVALRFGCAKQSKNLEWCLVCMQWWANTNTQFSMRTNWGLNTGKFYHPSLVQCLVFWCIIQGSPTCMVSTSMISTSTNFQKVLHKVVLVGYLISKFVLVELAVCTTQLVRILHSTIFSRSQKSY